MLKQFLEDMEFKSAEQILKKWYTPLHGIPEIVQLQLEAAMKEYAEQFIDLAAENSKEMRYAIVENTLEEPKDILNLKFIRYQACYAVAKQDILNVKKLIK